MDPKVEVPRKPPIDSLEGTAAWGFAMISLQKPDGQVVSAGEFAKQLAVPTDHPRYQDIRLALTQTCEFYRVIGILGDLGIIPPTPDPTKSFVSTGAESPAIQTNEELQKEYVRRINNWPAGKSISFPLAFFADTLANNLEARGVTDIAQRVKALVAVGHQNNSSG